MDDVTTILSALNDAQREAVSLPPVSGLVLAGAGSGKTRVLVHRIAWLIQVEQVSPYSILAVTFTNKAAAEMRARVETLLQIPAGGLWLGTFHGISHRLLRLHWRDAGLPQPFQILDSDDQLRLVKRVVRGLELDEARFPPKQAQWFINARKDDGQRPGHIEDRGDEYARQMVRIYAAYESACQRAGVVDFAELLLRTLELLRDQPALRAHYQSRFRHLLVDEFQDTNTLQYAWLRLIAGEHIPVFAVGDDDQSIYGWRGAKVENIRRFPKDFPGTQMVRLEQNYRSTGNILAAANALIAHNQGRMGKNLWTEDKAGEPLQLYTAFNEQDEARFIGERVKAWMNDGRPYRQVAVLYRSNAQSRMFEETFIGMGIPYRVYGGLRFFERAEIKDALAYLRLTANTEDDTSFERVVNQPPRGIGEKTLEHIRATARGTGLSLHQSAAQLALGGGLPTRQATPLRGILHLLEQLREAIRDLPLHETVEHLNTHSGLKAHFAAEKGEAGQSRVENLDELVSAARAFEYDAERDGEMSPRDAFLAHAVLEAGEGQGSAWDDCVQMMTLHSAKGLEFPLVFLCGLEEGLFPHQMSLDEPGRLEEERRLCYVGITRARERLVLSCAERRRLHGTERYNMPSQFLREIPLELIQEIRARTPYSAPRPGPSGVAVSATAPFASAQAGIPLGARVVHAKFGRGVVTNYEGQGASARVEVRFADVGSKWLVLAYAKLQVV
ncbi:MAG: DNA helicase II [Thiotrichales bacterium]